MGASKHIRAEKLKESRKTLYLARLTNVPTSPRKMRLVADLVRGVDVNKALNLLKFSKKDAADTLEKVLRSAIANFEVKSGKKADEEELFVKTVFVDSARQLKRIRPAPQGRAHRIRKRSNHITLVLDIKNNTIANEVKA